MKKTILLPVMMLCVLAVSAQGLKFGLKAGANIDKVQGKSFKEEFKFGFQAGGFATINLNKKWGIQPEVLFTQTNTTPSTQFQTIYQSAADPNYLKDVKLNYLSIPILLNYSPVPLLTLQAGPQFGILMNQHQTLLANGKDAFKKGDFSMLVGAQIKLLALRIYGRYQIGLTNINDIDNQDKWKNQAIQVGLGFAL